MKSTIDIKAINEGKRFLPCNIYRSDYDSTANVCHGCNNVYLPIVGGFMTLEKIEANKERRDSGYVDLQQYTTPLVIKQRGDYIYCEPLQPVPAGSVGYMFGGTYVCTSDSRYNETFGFSYPLPLHDRTETQEQYNHLST